MTNSKSSSSTQKTGSSQSAPTNPFAIDSSSTTSNATSPVNAGKTPQISPETMNALFAAQSQSTDSTGSAASSTSSSSTSSTSTSRDAALKDLFSQIDGDGDGKITKSEFENALGAGGTNLAQADDVFSKMDTNSDGSVSLDEMSKALKSGHHGHAHGASGSGDGSDSASKPSGGSTSTTTTAADGSTTTTVTYADGFKMSTTVPGASSSSRNSAYDLFAQLMQRQGGQGQGASATAGSSMSMSV
ncbi:MULTISPECIES: EF-hand domain-containing protein [Bradyrhizobium]|uniref:EF-hand domain-containing protein n=1 Tax=Bradyrhizobium barranii subsp. barranii TaxID=2823807 RepID=A0A9X9Z7B9_9BRAD|nr:EF-hand domain-containing protein [Bradyrhizobium barranii]UGX99074.1 EF-hand domain-containing protein [Bradyrhizobium barranii subsp. barranii]